MRNKLQIVKKFIIKNLLGMIIGGLIVGSISIATANYAFEGSNVYYDKSSSGGSYSNVQGALNELYGKVASGKKVYYIKNVSLTKGSNCAAFSHGSWKSLSSTNGSCIFTATLPVSIPFSSDQVCTGGIKGNYSSESETSSDEDFRWGGGAPYTEEIVFGASIYTGSYGATLWNNTSSVSFTGIHWKCYVNNNVLNVEFRGQKETSSTSDSASYGWQTRGDSFYFSGYIIY